MKLALLGCDDESLDLLRAALASGHTLAAAYDAAGYHTQLRQLAPLVRLDDDWESLLVGSVADGVIVARGKLDPSAETGFSGSERRDDQLRKLAQAAVPMLVVHPACEMIVGYELEMIREAAGGMLRPYFPGLEHPAWSVLASLTSDENSPLGPIEQVLFERQMADRSRGTVLTQFARDVFQLARLIGPIAQLAARGSAASEYRDPLGPASGEPPSLANLDVHLGSTRSLTGRWSVVPPREGPGGTVTIQGASARAVLHMPAAANQHWLLEILGSQPAREEFPAESGSGDPLNGLHQAIAAADREETQWLDACHAVEAASVIDRSLSKGRAIDLFTDRPSEEQSFKGVMAVWGCLLLAITLLGVFVVVLVEALQLDIRRWPAWRLWPLFLVAPILIFLLAQSLHVVARRKVKPEAAGNGAAANDAV